MDTTGGLCHRNRQVHPYWWRAWRDTPALCCEGILISVAFAMHIEGDLVAPCRPLQAARAPQTNTFFSRTEKTGRGDTSEWTDTPQLKAEKARKM